MTGELKPATTDCMSFNRFQPKLNGFIKVDRIHSWHSLVIDMSFITFLQVLSLQLLIKVDCMSVLQTEISSFDERATLDVYMKQIITGYFLVCLF